MTWQFFTKALWAGLVAGLGALSTALIAIEGSFSDLPDGVWVSAGVLFLVAFGGVLGWQEAPAKVSTSVRD